MAEPLDLPNWIGNRRSDGVMVQKDHSAWHVVGLRGEKITSCPCCRFAMGTRLAAQKVAEVYFPLEKTDA